FNLEVVQLNTTKVADLRYQWERFSTDSLAFQEIENAEAALFTPNGPGRYRCRTVSGGFCEVISSTIDVLTPPSAILGDTVYCEGTAINLHIDQGFLPDLGAFSIDWFYSEDGQSFERINRTIQDSLFIPESSPLYRSGYYFYEASKESCVKTSDTLRITKNEDSFSATLFGASNQTRGVPFQFSINTDDTEQVFSYQWSPEEFLDFTDGSRGIFTVPESFETDSILVSVQVTSEGGCSLNRSLTVFLNEVGELLFPKFISPNGDGLNDLFIITGIDDQKENDLRIIDGWGNTLYRFKNFYNQETQAKRLAERIRNEGVYYYLFEEAGEKIRKGSFYVRGQ
ncbi:MAG: gliding motility-associated C-terminal domain-containing protein, partial [Bacteroidota bacterium]